MPFSYTLQSPSTFNFLLSSPFSISRQARPRLASICWAAGSWSLIRQRQVRGPSPGSRRRHPSASWLPLSLSLSLSLHLPACAWDPRGHPPLASCRRGSGKKDTYFHIKFFCLGKRRCMRIRPAGECIACRENGAFIQPSLPPCMASCPGVYPTHETMKNNKKEKWRKE
jgi:hypothetical protein